MAGPGTPRGASADRDQVARDGPAAAQPAEQAAAEGEDFGQGGVVGAGERILLDVRDRFGQIRVREVPGGAGQRAGDVQATGEDDRLEAEDAVAPAEDGGEPGPEGAERAGRAAAGGLLQQGGPEAIMRPATEAAGDGGRRTMVRADMAPGDVGEADAEDGIEAPAGVAERAAGAGVFDVGLEDGPLGVGERGPGAGAVGAGEGHGGSALTGDIGE